MEALRDVRPGEPLWELIETAVERSAAGWEQGGVGAALDLLAEDLEVVNHRRLVGPTDSTSSRAEFVASMQEIWDFLPHVRHEVVWIGQVSEQTVVWRCDSTYSDADGNEVGAVVLARLQDGLITHYAVFDADHDEQVLDAEIVRLTRL